MKVKTLCIYNEDNAQRVTLSLIELSRAVQTDLQFIQALVENDLLSPAGHSPETWQFDALCLKRAKRAASFHQDLEIDFSGIALALDLMDRIDSLEAHIAFLEKWEK